MRLHRLFPVLILVLGGCSDAPMPSEASLEPSRPQFGTSGNGGDYTAIDLGTLGGDRSEAVAINDAGQVVGRSRTSSGWQYHAFLWDGTLHDLGTLDGRDDIYSWSEATAINDGGQVVGRSSAVNYGLREWHAFLWDGTLHDLGTLGGRNSLARAINAVGQVTGTAETSTQNQYHAFLWDGTMHDLGHLGGSYPYSTATAINDAGQVTGYSNVSGALHAFLWDGTMHDLGTLGGSESYARAINNAGQVVGYSSLAGGHRRAFLWDGAMHELGTRCYYNSDAYAINEGGQVVGRCGFRVPWHAFLWDGTMHDLGTLDDADPSSYSNAVDINEGGQVVGYSKVSGALHAFLWDGTMHDLGTLGGDNSWAVAINERGHVVGISQTASGEHHATLWRALTPVERVQACATEAANLETEGVLNQGQTRSLVNKIKVATALLNDGREGPAIRVLEAFRTEVEQLVGSGLIPSADGQRLTDCIQTAIESVAS